VGILEPIQVSWPKARKHWMDGRSIGETGGNPQQHGENMQTSHIKASWLSWNSNLGTFLQKI